MNSVTRTVQELIDDGVLAPPMDGNHGSIHPKTVDYVDAGVPFVMASDLVNGRVDTRNCAFLSNEQANSLRKGFAKSGDVLLSHKATIGRTAIVGPIETDFIMLTPQVTYYRVIDEARLSRRYLYYYFKSRPFQQLLGQWAGAGSTRSYLGITGQRKLPIVIPEPSAQHAIVSRLGSIDDKIELNHQVNETLEEMARAVFRDWFVDFGPTRRRMDGAKDPVTIMGGAFPAEKAATLATLFPAQLGDNSLPEGWSYSDIGDEFDVEMGQSPPGDTYNETGDGLPFFQGRRDFGFRFPSRRVYCTAPKRISGRDWTLLSVRAPVGDINRAAEECAIGRGVGAFLHKAGLHSFTYYTGLALRAELQSYDKDGTVFGSINQKQFKGLRVVVPISDAAARFDEVVKPMDDKIRLNAEENQTLAEMRDLLLPKLMSGEIRLSGVEATA